MTLLPNLDLLVNMNEIGGRDCNRRIEENIFEEKSIGILFQKIIFYDID